MIKVRAGPRRAKNGLCAGRLSAPLTALVMHPWFLSATWDWMTLEGVQLSQIWQNGIFGWWRLPPSGLAPTTRLRPQSLREHMQGIGEARSRSQSGGLPVPHFVSAAGRDPAYCPRRAPRADNESLCVYLNPVGPGLPWRSRGSDGQLAGVIQRLGGLLRVGSDSLALLSAAAYV